MVARSSIDSIVVDSVGVVDGVMEGVVKNLKSFKLPEKHVAWKWKGTLDYTSN